MTHPNQQDDKVKLQEAALVLRQFITDNTSVLRTPVRVAADTLIQAAAPKAQDEGEVAEAVKWAEEERALWRETTTKYKSLTTLIAAAQQPAIDREATWFKPEDKMPEDGIHVYGYWRTTENGWEKQTCLWFAGHWTPSKPDLWASLPRLPENEALALLKSAEGK